MKPISTKFVVRLLDAGPSLNETTLPGGDMYLDAVHACHTAWRRTGRRARVCRNGSVFTWHVVAADGSFTDKNFNSGVPDAGTVQPYKETLT